MSGAVVTAGVPGTAAVRLTRDEAARVLWDLHYAPLAGWCATMLRDRDAAHDVVSEAFVRLLTRWPTVRDPKGFLYVTAHNLVRDIWRREERERKLHQRLEQTVATTTPAADPSVRDLVERLPERMRAAVLLYYYGDLSVAEIASALRRPGGTVKRFLHDARDILRAELKAAP